MRIASDRAIFGQPETGLGIIPGFAGTQRLSRLVGKGMAKMMIFTSMRIKADEALRIGLVQRVVPHESLMDEAKKLANQIASCSPNAVRLAKSPPSIRASKWTSGRQTYMSHMYSACASQTAIRSRA